MRDLMFAILLGQMVFYLGFLGCVRTKPDACRLVARHPPRLCRPFSRRFHGRRSDEWPSIMLPADPDAKIVWSCFVIARHKDGLGVADILPEAAHAIAPRSSSIAHAAAYDVCRVRCLRHSQMV